MLILAAVALLLLLAHRWGRQAPWHDPAIIHASLWTAISLVTAAFPELSGYPSRTTIFVLSTGLIAFSAGIAAADAIPSENRAIQSPAPVNSPKWLPPLLAVLAVGSLLAVAYRAAQIVPVDGIAGWIAKLRYAVTQHGQSFGWAGYMANLGLTATFVVLIIARSPKDSIAASVAVAAAALTALLLTGRTYLLLFATLTIVAIGAQRHRPIAIWQVFAAAAACVAAFLMATLSRYTSGLAIADSGSTLYFHLLHYVPAGIIGFDAQIAREDPLSLGIYTFRTILAVLKALGADVIVVNLVRPYVMVPFSTNVYTALSPYYSDFGILGIVIFFFGFGCLTGWTRLKIMKKPDPCWLMLYGILLYAMLMQFFQDQYLSLLSNWLQLIFWTYLITQFQRLRGS